MKRAVILITLVLTAFLAIATASSRNERNSGSIFSAPIAIYGDSRTDSAAHLSVIEAIAKTNPKIVFSTGDLVADGNIESQWDAFFQIISNLPKGCRYYPAIGNHEAGSKYYFDRFELPNNERWYSVHYRNLHFIILDSNEDLSPGSKQYDWLEGELKNSKGDFKIAIDHHPPFSSGPHREDEKGLRKSIVPLFERYNVSALFSGHDHIYERSLHNGIYYIVTGGGGAPLYDSTQTNEYSEVFAKRYHFCALVPSKSSIEVFVLGTDLKQIARFRIYRAKM